MTRTGAPAPERFWQKIVISDGCWLWTAHKNNKGYGVFSPKWNAKVYAHRWSYEQSKGTIPEGLELDHLCRNPACVNPDHLEAVSHRENQLRGKGPVAVNAARTSCVNGHPFDDENTYWRPDGGRNCRACNSERSARRQRAVRRAAENLGVSVSDYIDLHGESMGKALQLAGAETQPNPTKETT